MQRRKNRYIQALCGSMAGVMLLCCLAGCGEKAESEPTELPSAISTAVQTDETTAPVETTTEWTAAETEASAVTTAAEAESTSEAETTEAQTTQKTPQTKAEILALFNESINRVKPDSKSVKVNYVLNSQTSDATLSNKVLQKIANQLISANMGYDKKQAGLTFDTVADRNAKFPARGQTWSSKLTESDLTGATCTEKDGVYTVVLTLIPDTTPNIRPGEGHAGKAFSIITKDQIVEGAGSLGMSVIQEDSIKLTFKDCKITAKIDKETGHVTDANYYQDWTLSLTALGIDVSVSFGAEDDFSIQW